MDAQTRNELRRVNTFLQDPERYEKFRMLTKGQQKKVLDLVEANQGKKARKITDAMDQDRRKARRIKDSVRRFLKKTPLERSRDRPTDWTSELWREYDRQAA